MSEIDESVRGAPRLTIIEGPFDGPAMTLSEDGTIGRRRDNRYVLASARVSRVHARVHRNGSRVIITDLGSRAGTRVNGIAITGPHVLRDGDRVQFGPVVTVFEDPSWARTSDRTDVFEVPREHRVPHLSPRQKQVLERMAQGMTNAEIGEALGVSERTVKAYARELFDRLEVDSRTRAVAEGLKQGVLEV